VCKQGLKQEEEYRWEDEIFYWLIY